MFKRSLSFVLCFAVAAVWVLPAQAQSFGGRTVVRAGQPHGVVTCLGADLFELTVPAGGLTAPKRAEVVAERLNNLEATHDLTVAQFSVGFRNGEVIIQHHQHAEHQPHIVVTVDRALAKQIPGARGQAERLAQWWLALFRDRIALLHHEVPYFTAGTRIADVFSKVYAPLRSQPAKELNPEQKRAALRQVIENLSPTERQTFFEACYRVPDDYDPNKVIVVVSAQDESGHPHKKDEVEAGPPSEDQAKPKPMPAPPAPQSPTPVKTEEQPEPKPDVKPVPPAPTTAATANARSIVSGKTRIGLLTDPKILTADKDVDVQIKLTDTSKKDPVLAEEEAVRDAVVRCWFVRAGEDNLLSPPIAADYDKEKSSYGFTCAFPEAGTYRLIVGALLPDAEVLKVEFSLSVQKKDDNAPAVAAATNAGNAPQRPARTGSARDFIVARRAPDNVLELGWQQEQPVPRSVTFVLRGNGGKDLSSRKLSSAPFAAKFPIPQGLTEIRFTVEYASGVVNTVVLPFSAVK
jgi:hypothetical protein